jgi:hypothetical protein
LFPFEVLNQLIEFHEIWRELYAIGGHSFPNLLFHNFLIKSGARGSVIMWGTMLTSWKEPSSSPDEVIGFFNWRSPSSRTMALGSTQPLKEISTRNLPGGKDSPARKANNLTAIYEPIV